MKPALKSPSPAAAAPAPDPTSGGSYLRDPATGALVRNPPPVEPAVAPVVQAPVEPPVETKPKEAL